MRIVGSPNVVWVDGQSGRVALGLFLTNKGTVPYACKALTATQIPTKGVYRGRFSPPMVVYGTWPNNRAGI